MTAAPPMPPLAASATVLLERAAAGDVEAFATLVTRYRPAALAAIARKLSDPHEQEDAMQETLVAAWRGLGDLRDPERFGAWLGQIAARKADGWHRRRYAQQRMHDLLGEPEPPGPPPVHPAVSAAYWRLSRDHRRVILGHYYKDQTYEQLSASLHIPTDLVRSRLQKARNHLRKTIETMQRTDTPPTTTLHFRADEVATLIALSAACYEGPDNRPALRGVLLDGPRQRATATDGRHLLTRPLDALKGVTEPLIVDGLPAVRGAFSTGGTMTLGVDAVTLRDDATGEEFSLPILDADFPDYGRFLDLAPAASVTVALDAFRDAAEKFSSQPGGAAGPLQVAVEDGTLVLAGSSGDADLRWRHEARLPASGATALPPVRVDARLVLHAVRALRPAGRVTVGWNGALDTIVVSDADHPGHRAVVMPVKVTEVE